MIQEISLYCNDPALGEFKNCMEGPGVGYVHAISSGKEKNSFSKVDAKICCSILKDFKP